MLRPASRRRRWLLASSVAVVLLVVTVAVAVFLLLSRSGLEATGPEAGVLLNAATVGDLAVTVEADRPGALDAATLTVDGRDATAEVTRTPTSLTWAPGSIADGAHEVRVAVPAARPLPSRELGWSFTVDQTAPELVLDATDTVVLDGEPVSVTGTAGDDAAVTADGAEVDRAGDGTFTLSFDTPPAELVQVVAADAAGNRVTEEVAFVTVPSRVMVDRIRGVHVTAQGWTSAQLREDVLDMARAGRINAVQLDLKDEEGLVGFDTANPFAAELGAAQGLYDLDEAVTELHDLGVEIVGRIVVFRDGLFARHAWENGRPEDVVRTAGGELYTGDYEGFGNIASEAVWEYNIAIAEEAAAAGVDNILWDYVRKPDGAVSNFTFDGLDPDVEPERAAQDAVLGFIAAADERLEPYGVKHGASVYGVAATRPHEIAQDVSGMARYVDYVAPMVYPSHWAPGEFGVADPNASPGLIVQRSLEGFLSEVEGTDAEVVPWLQDFPWPVRYTPEMVRDQITMAADIGVDQWLMWNAGVYYQESAYDVIPDADTAADHAGT